MELTVVAKENYKDALNKGIKIKALRELSTREFVLQNGSPWGKSCLNGTLSYIWNTAKIKVI